MEFPLYILFVSGVNLKGMTLEPPNKGHIDDELQEIAGGNVWTIINRHGTVRPLYNKSECIIISTLCHIPY